LTLLLALGCAGKLETAAPVDTAETGAAAALCPALPEAAAPEAVVLEGEYEKATGIYALPDTLLGSGGMLGMIKVKDLSGGRSRLQVFTSTDGAAWDAARGCAISWGEEGSWSDNGVGTASLRQVEGAVEAWYRADGGEERIQSVGYTRSEDGCDWPVPAEPVLAPSEDWASHAVIGPHVVEREGGALWMYYRGSRYENQSESPLGVATSEDGLSWTPRPDNPVMDLSEDGWDSSLLADPHVWEARGRWLMLYSAHGRETTPEMSTDEVGLGKAIGLAASWDGLRWERCGEGPLIAAGVKADNPFFWMEGDDAAIYYRTTDLEDGSGGWIERVIWPDWPRWEEGPTAARRSAIPWPHTERE
jgi:hypothetical protein